MSNEDVEVSIEVTNVVSLLSVTICDVVADSVELDIVLRAVSEIVDSSDDVTELVTNVDSSYRSVVISDKIVVLSSLLSADDNLFSNISEVVIMTFISLVDIGVIVGLFDTSFDDISSEDFVCVRTGRVIDVVNKSLLFFVLDEILFVCILISLVVVSELLLLVAILSFVTSFVCDTIDKNVDGLFKLSTVETV